MLDMVHFGLHRDPRYFPDPHSFRPERWLEGAIAGDSSREKESEVEDPLSPPERSHPHVCRPFEVGHRACIGQDLALVERKIVLALTTRRFDITACYGLEEESEKKALIYKCKCLGAPAYAKYGFRAKVSGGLPVGKWILV
ncbi:cytochrome P450 [Phyllosticta citricarpa]